MYKIMIVEDEELIANLLDESVVQCGYEVVGVFDDGDSAIKHTFSHEVDVILMDINLKGDMDGIQTAEKIKAIYDLPLIYITGSTDRNILDRAKITQPDAFLIKPFKIEDVQSNIEMAVYRHELDMNRRLESIYNKEVDYNTFLKSLGKIFKDLRKQRGLSQADFAKEMQINYRHYQDLEGGKSNLKLETLFNLARFHELSIPELFESVN